jgi:protein-tyrosine kinase
MSLVEKALRKLQTSRGTLEVGRTPAAAARSEPTVPVQSSSVEELSFDPSRHTSRIVRIDVERLRALKMLPPPSQERQIATQFRSLKRPLIRHALEADQTGDILKRTLMVASALPGDGKTFTTLNLAMSLALELDLRVLLIDADTPKRHLTQTLELDREPGLLDVIAGTRAKVEELILPTEMPRLDILPIGTRSENSTELVASARMAETVMRLAGLYRRGIVLFDSPPILLTNEARSLATILGQIVLVVRAGATPQRAVKDAVDALGENRRVSIVLNCADLDGAAGYYYGHRYGHGYGEDVSSQRPPSSDSSR